MRNLTRCPECGDLAQERTTGECDSCGHQQTCLRCGDDTSPADATDDFCSHDCRAAAEEEAWAELSLDR